MNEIGLPVMFIYDKDNRLVATRVMHQNPPAEPGERFPSYTANVADIPAGDYEYELAGDPGDDELKGKRFRLELRD